MSQPNAESEFVRELAERLNSFLKQDPERANAVLATPIPHAKYTGVAHFLGVLALPPHATDETYTPSADQLFLYPIIENQRIQRFEVVSGEFLAQAAALPGPQIH